MKIYIEDLKFQTILGILDFERKKEQNVVVNLTIEYQYTNQFINYAEVATFVKKVMQNEKFYLIEDALKILSQKLKKEFSLIETLYIKITKPSILADAQVSVSEFYTF